MERGKEIGMGWYGPLIDLSAATCYVGQYVQLIVFLHRTTPIVEYKILKGRSREVVRTDIQVGDETRPLFCVSIWNSFSAAPGDIIFLRNVKLFEFRNMVEARTVHFSSIIRLIHPYSSFLSQGVDHLLASCPLQLVATSKDKLQRLILWVQSTTSTLSISLLTPATRNWKVHEEQKPHERLLLPEVLNMSCSSKVIFLALIGEIFLHSLWPDSKNERLFISRRLASKIDIIVEDMICLGCQLCGLPLSTNSKGVMKDDSLYCEKSSNQLHVVGLIYRPFMLYVWDESDYIPLLVTNKAAELVFGNIIAEDVYKSYKCQKDEHQLKTSIKVHDFEKIERNGVGSSSSIKFLGFESRKKSGAKSPNLYMIWLIVVKMLLVRGKNSPLMFEVFVSPELDIEDGRFKMISFSMSYAKS